MAKKDLGLSKLKYYPRKVVKQISAKHLTLFKRRVVTEGRDAKGKEFPEYSTKYKELKASGMKKKSGGRLKGYEGIRISTEVNKPNFKLRGLTMINLRKRNIKPQSYKLGWRGEAAAIVEGNADRIKKKRDIINDIPDDEMNKVVRMLANAIEKQHRKHLKNIKVVAGK